MILAAHFGHAEVCELLLERGNADIEETEPKGNTALNLAAQRGHASTVALLLSKGAKVDTKDNDGFTTLLAAVQKGHTEVCELLLEAGGDVEERAPDTLLTPLHSAAINNHETIIKRARGATEHHEIVAEALQCLRQLLYYHCITLVDIFQVSYTWCACLRTMHHRLKLTVALCP